VSFPAGFSRDPTDVVWQRVGAHLIDYHLTALIALAIFIPFLLNMPEREEHATSAAASQRCAVINTPPEEPNGGTATDHGSAVVCIPWGRNAYILSFGDMFRAVGVYFLIHLPLLLANYVILEGLTSATVGKRAVGLRVVREDGQRIGMPLAALRLLLLIAIDSQCFIGFILALTSKGHRRLGDMAASTFVVDKADAGRPVVVPGLTVSATPAGAYPPTWGGPGPAVAASPDGPRWDEVREAYIAYDRDQAAWLEWDEGRSRWKPIDT
jgi:uncharacterized RDD family membrane protein YckC